MAVLTVALAQFQAMVTTYGGPVVYTTTAGGNVISATINPAYPHLFEFSPRPTETAFLAVLPAAIRVADIGP